MYKSEEALGEAPPEPMSDKEGKGFLEGESFLLPLLLAMRKNRGKTDLGSPLDLIATGNIKTDLKRVVLGPKYEMATRLQSKFFICPKEGKIEQSGKIMTVLQSQSGQDVDLVLPILELGKR